MMNVLTVEFEIIFTVNSMVCRLYVIFFEKSVLYVRIRHNL